MNAFSSGKRHVIHDVIRTLNAFTYTTKSMFVRGRNNKTQQIRR